MKIRLNEKDYRAAQCNPGCSPSYKAECWAAACEATHSEIFNRLPLSMREKIMEVRKTLPQKREDARCTRCKGQGCRNDRQDWVILKRGRVCFACKESGIERSMEPVFFRRRLMDTLLATKDAEKVDLWARKVMDNPENPYFCVMQDIAETWLDGGDIRTLPF